MSLKVLINDLYIKLKFHNLKVTDHKIQLIVKENFEENVKRENKWDC